MTSFDYYLSVCGWPTATTSDVSAWKTLEVGALSASTTKVGLFGYDITCLMEACAIKEEVSYACTWLFAGHKDGWSMGFEVEIVAADSGDMSICQHQEFTGDLCISKTLTGYGTDQFDNSYSVVAGTAPPTYSTFGGWSYYG